MTVHEIFDLRKQGRIEEAYEAIRPMYAVHKGRYTTLCMFWVASDVLKLRIEQGRIEEAKKIYRSLERVLKEVTDYEIRAGIKTGASVAAMREASELLNKRKTGLNAGQQTVLDCIRAHEGIKVPGISEATNIPSKSIERHVKALIEHHLIEHRGSKKTGGYYAI